MDSHKILGESNRQITNKVSIKNVHINQLKLCQVRLPKLSIPNNIEKLGDNGNKSIDLYDIFDDDSLEDNIDANVNEPPLAINAGNHINQQRNIIDRHWVTIDEQNIIPNRTRSAAGVG